MSSAKRTMEISTKLDWMSAGRRSQCPCYTKVLRERRLTIELDEERQFRSISIDVLLHAVRKLLPALRNASAPSSLDRDPINLVDVGDLELLDDLRWDRPIVLLLRVLDLLRKLGESVGSKLGDGGGDASLVVFLDLLGEGGGGLADDGDRASVDVPPAKRFRFSRGREKKRTHLLRRATHCAEVQPLSVR